MRREVLCIDRRENEKEGETEMIYATADLKGTWTIFKGWMGCEAGQGDTIKRGVEGKNVNKEMEILRKKERRLK